MFIPVLFVQFVRGNDLQIFDRMNVHFDFRSSTDFSILRDYVWQPSSGSYVCNSFLDRISETQGMEYACCAIMVTICCRDEGLHLLHLLPDIRFISSAFQVYVFDAIPLNSCVDLKF